MKYFKNWGVGKIFASRRKARQEHKIKSYFRNYFSTDPFEGVSSSSRRVISVEMLGITNIKFSYKNRRIIMEIWLEHPGRLIGPRGQTMNGVTEFIQRRVPKQFSIKIKESTLWQ